MTKDTFLQDISSMNRDEIIKYFDKQRVRKKKITPLIILGKEENRGDDMNGHKNKQSEGSITKD